MEIILTTDIKGLGQALDVVKVKNGYARNFLFPSALAELATPDKISLIEKDREAAKKLYVKEKEGAEAIVEQIENLSLNIAKKVSEDDKLYGSVTNKEIVDALQTNNITIQSKNISIDSPIKKLGRYEVKIVVPPGKEAKLTLWIVDEKENNA